MARCDYRKSQPLPGFRSHPNRHYGGQIPPPAWAVPAPVTLGEMQQVNGRHQLRRWTW